MLERFYLKNHLGFEEVALEFDKNFVVFTGPSGAGKSVLMEALLALFGLKECDAKVIEASVERPLGLDAFGIDEEHPNIFRRTKERSTRYFINSQQLSQKNVRTVSKSFIRYLTLREFNEFEHENLITLLDAIASRKSKSHVKCLKNFADAYRRFRESSRRLAGIEEEEKRIAELREFTQFEIDKIEKVAPRPDEYETLMEQKRALSRKEKIEEALGEASAIFAFTSKVSEALALIESDSAFFDEAMSELESRFEETRLKLEELGDLDIEALLTRIEQLSELKRKHGSIEEALAYLDEKREALVHYDNIAFEKEALQKEVAKYRQEVDELSGRLSEKRRQALEILQERVEHYLNQLYLEKITFSLKQAPLSETGVDSVTLELKNTDLKKISSGELNRLRLAFLAASGEFVQSEGGVLILDEIDANVSGKESMRIATVLQQLSKSYQIFAISHQPQLSSSADLHFLVRKTNGKSSVTRLDEAGRIRELSRMISAEEITEEATNFAKSLLAQKRSNP